MRRLLDRVYDASFYASAACFVFVGAVLFAQIVGRPLGIIVPSATELAAYAMAASTFLALANVLRAGHHIRVHLLIEKLPRRARRLLDLWTSLFTAVTLGYFALYTAEMVWDSFDYGAMSPGLLAIPLWIPQAAMALGLFLMALACVEDVVRLSRGEPPSYEPAPGSAALSE